VYPVALSPASRSVNDVDLLAPGLMGHDVGEKGHELRRGVARSHFAQHLAGLGIEGGVQRKHTVAIVFKAVSLGWPGQERQDGGPYSPAPGSRSFRSR